MELTATPATDHSRNSAEPSPARIAAAFLVALAFVLATRIPVTRTEPLESDEFGFLEMIREHYLPMHHTLFLASGRAFGALLGDGYRGFVALDMLVSAVALTSVWWFLLAVVPPAAAVAATSALGVSPLFWMYGAMAGNYTMIPAVGAFLLGVAVRSRTRPRPGLALGATVALAWGTGYREDVGLFWLPVYFLILSRLPRKRAGGLLALFTVLNLLWIGAMLLDVGLASYRTKSGDFAHSAGYLNSIFHLGLIDAPARYAVKLVMALIWTFGPGLALACLGASRTFRDGNPGLLGLFALSVLPALAFHLLIHFGSQGYAFHYIPALMGLTALGALGTGDDASTGAIRRLGLTAAALASVFLFYPTDYSRPGIRGDFDLAFARCTRIGLRTPMPETSPKTWRTANSRLSTGVPPRR